MMFDWGKRTYHNIGTIEPDDSPPVDHVVNQHIKDAIYGAWDESKYGHLLDFGGGVMVITTKMILAAGEDFLETLPGIGPKRAETLMERIAKASLMDAAYR